MVVLGALVMVVATAVVVRKALLRALDEVEAVDDWLGSRLRTALRTGHVCSLQL